MPCETGSVECGTAARLLVRRTADTLPAVDADALAAHLDACDDCRDAADLMPPAPAAASWRPDLPRVDARVFAEAGILGEGGMGTTHLALDGRLERNVALKRPRTLASAERNRDLLARFEREARLTARLQHPAIVSIYEAGYLVADGREELYYAMQPVDGDELQVAIERRPQLAERLGLLPHVTTIANAVAYAHERGIVHRDVKPANILVGRFGEAVLIDWGLAAQLAETGTADDEAEPAGAFTRMGVGTTSYMPPEQALGEAADPRFDVYALGATLYHLLAGVPPYGDTATRDALRAGPPRSLAAHDAKIPAELISITEKAMARDPARRFATARELAEELARYQSGQLVRSHRHRMRDLAWRWIRRHRAAVVAACVAIVAIAAVGVYALSRVLTERTTAVRAQATAEDAARRSTAALERSLLVRGATELSLGRNLTAANLFVRARSLGDDRGAARMAARWSLDRARLVPVATVELEAGLDTLVTTADGLVASTGKRIVQLGWDGVVLGYRTMDGPTIALDETTGHVIAAARDGVALVLSPRLGELARLPADAARKLDDQDYGTVAVSRDGAYAVAGTNDGRVVAWSLAEPYRRRELLVESGSIHALSFAPDGRVAILSEEVDAAIVDVRSGERVAALSGIMDSHEVRFSGDGSRLFTASGFGVYTWSGAGGRSLRHLDMTDTFAASGTFGIALSPDDALLADARGDQVFVWRTDTFQLLEVLDVRADSVRFAADGRIVTLNAADGAIAIWPPILDASRSVPLYPPSMRHTDVSRGSGTVALLYDDRIDVYELDAGVGGYATKTLAITEGRLVVQPEHGCVVGVVTNRALHVFDRCGAVLAGTRVCALPEDLGRPFRAVIADDGTATLYSETGWARPCESAAVERWCSGCRAVRVTAQFGHVLAVLRAPTGVVLRDLVTRRDHACDEACARAKYFTVMPDGKRVFVADDFELSTFEVATGVWTRLGSVASGRTVRAIASYPDTSVVAASDDKGLVTLFDVDNGVRLLEIRCSAFGTRNVEFVGDSLYCVTNEAIRRFDLSAPSTAEAMASVADMVAARRARGDLRDIPLELDMTPIR
jgi:WD40 repeat protein